MKQNFDNELRELKSRVIGAINNEVTNKGGKVELSTDDDLLTLDMYPTSVDYASRFEILGISDSQLHCRDVEADCYFNFWLSEIDVENLIFIYEQI